MNKSTEFRSSTPIDINKRSIAEVLPLIYTGANIDTAAPRVRLNIAKMLYDVLRLDLTPDVALATASEPRSTLVLATAGGGKTTWAQVKAVAEKISRPSKYHPGKKIKGDAILCLVYNKHNVDDMKKRHRQIVTRLQSACIRGLDIDSEINACTMHSFCEFWRKEYISRMELLGYSLLDDVQSNAIMRRSIRIAFKKLGKENTADKIDSQKVLELYQLKLETMCKSVSDLRNSDKFIDLGMDEKELDVIFDRYEASKKLHRKYDFIDMLVKFHWLLSTDQKAKERIQQYYEYVIADEVQDFTPLMWSILRLMVDDGTPVTCIGDEDQNIYGFRGASIYSILEFQSMFQDAKVYSLFYNRRCRKRILDEARKVVEMNKLRFNKVLLGNKEGGEVVYVPYNSVKGQIINVVRSIKEMDIDIRQNTVVCYRDSSCSTLLSDMLMEEDIPFNVISGDKAFSYELYRHLFGVLDALEMPCDVQVYYQLYKVLPCSRNAFFHVIGYDPYTKKITGKDALHKHFSELDYGALNEIKHFQDCIQMLTVLSGLIASAPLYKIVPKIFELMGRYFWKFKKNINKRQMVDDVMEQRVLKFFETDLTYPQFYRSYQRKLNLYNQYTANHDGVTISTFHSLKGLEYRNVIVICMDNDIFPNFPLIEGKYSSERLTQQLKEGETRLWYVAVTRAIDKLTVYYSKTNPSYFVQCALNDSFQPTAKFEDIMSGTEDFIDEDLDSTVGGEIGTETMDNVVLNSVENSIGFKRSVKSRSSEGGSIAELLGAVDNSMEFIDTNSSPTEDGYALSQKERRKQQNICVDNGAVTLKSGKSVYLNRLLQRLV